MLTEKESLMDDSKLILRFETHRWIEPKSLLPTNWFDDDKKLLVLSIKATEQSLQLINVAFLKQEYLTLIQNTSATEVYIPAIPIRERIINRISAELSKNWHWKFYTNIASSLEEQHVQRGKR